MSAFLIVSIKLKISTLHWTQLCLLLIVLDTRYLLSTVYCTGHTEDVVYCSLYWTYDTCYLLCIVLDIRKMSTVHCIGHTIPVIYCVLYWT